MWFPEKSCIFIDISIHAPREGGDTASQKHHQPKRNFNPRPPARGGDVLRGCIPCIMSSFQSTPPARGATADHAIQYRKILISIHAPREGGDRNNFCTVYHFRPYFNPRPPRGGRRRVFFSSSEEFSISIHAPREGGDFLMTSSNRISGRFQSTPPARGATMRLPISHSPLLFQSTPPARGATAKMHSFTCGSLTNK